MMRTTLSRSSVAIFLFVAAALPIDSPLRRTACALETSETSPGRPNILWITTEDLSPVIGCYGDPYAVTPNLDRLAAEGVRYTNAFASASVCTPVRSCLITGVFASSMGTQHLRGEQPLSPGIHCFTEHLRAAGYYCSNNVKEDYNFTTPEAAWDESSPRAHWRGRRADQPFFSVFNFMTTHQSRVRFEKGPFLELTARVKPEQRHDPAQAPVPPYYPDTPLVRADIAQLYDLVTAMDLQVQDLLDQLKEDGLAENTIVFFYSDHGTGMPRHKRWLYDSGIRVPLITRFPEKFRSLDLGEPGSTTDRLVSFVDFAPTVLSLAGLDIPDAMQGTAFLGPQGGPPRDFVFAIRDRVDEVFEMSRTVHDKRYQYIRNYMPHRPRMQYSTFSERTPTRKEFRRLAAAGLLRGAAAEMLSVTKPPEELYDVKQDPYQIHNLASDPEHRDRLEKLRSELHAWMLRTRDTGLIPEIEMRRRAAGGSPYDMAQQPKQFDAPRNLEVAELVGKGTGSRERLMELLDDEDAAVRYWAATGLAALGAGAAPASGALEECLSDPAANVRFTAAECLLGLGSHGQALETLVIGLQDQDPLARLYAAIAIIAVGEQARPIREQIRATADREPESGTYTMYTKWALEYALQGM